MVHTKFNRLTTFWKQVTHGKSDKISRLRIAALQKCSMSEIQTSIKISR